MCLLLRPEAQLLERPSDISNPIATRPMTHSNISAAVYSSKGRKVKRFTFLAGPRFRVLWRRSKLASSRPRHQLAAYRTAAHAQSAVQDPCDCYFPRSPERRRKFPELTNLKRSYCFCLMPLSYPDSQLPRPSGSRRGGGIGVPPNWLGRNRAAAPTKAASVTHHATVNPLGNPSLIACSRR